MLTLMLARGPLVKKGEVFYLLLDAENRHLASGDIPVPDVALDRLKFREPAVAYAVGSGHMVARVDIHGDLVEANLLDGGPSRVRALLLVLTTPKIEEL